MNTKPSLKQYKASENKIATKTREVREMSYVSRKNYISLFSEGCIQPIKDKAIIYIFVLFCFEMGIS